MEGIPNNEKQEGVPRSYLEKSGEFTRHIFEQVKGTGKFSRALAMVGLFTLATGCSVNISGSIAGKETGEKIAEQFEEYFKDANERARNAPSRQKDDYHFEHRVEGHLGVGIDSSGQRHLKINHRETKTTRAKGTAAEQHRNAQEDNN